VTAPAMNRLEFEATNSPERPDSGATTSDIAVKRVVSLLSELVAAGALPAL
jgi:hypothetical protein